MTGLVGCKSNSKTIMLFQYIEYLYGQLTDRGVEAICGSVTCLPGAFTFVRFHEFNKISKEYFKFEEYDLFNFWKKYLGEDKWMTSLLMETNESFQITMCNSAF